MVEIKYEVEKNGLLISTDPGKLDIDVIHKFLSEDSYWKKGISFQKVQRAVAHSLSFGIYDGNDQIGYARVISDFSDIAYLGDVFILESYRGKGLGKWLIETIINHPELQGLRRWFLGTVDAHGLYEKYGWKPLADTKKWMERT